MKSFFFIPNVERSNDIISSKGGYSLELTGIIPGPCHEIYS